VIRAVCLLLRLLRRVAALRLLLRLRRHVRAARLLLRLVSNNRRQPRSLNLVCFRLRGEHDPDRDPNEALLERLNASGALFLTHTRLKDRYTLRMSIGQTDTEERHVRDAWERIRAESL
jgi:aromatic-L-amino-acid decarboxylase